MAKGYRLVDRDQVFLLPPSMMDWLPEDHLVWFVIEAVNRLDTAAFHARARPGGVGRAGYDPDMLLTLLVYAMAHGQRSSRRIERLCATDVAFRIICASDVPDHTVLARFRRDHEQALEDLLTQVLRLCAQLGMVRLGVVAFDGTKIAASAAKDKNYTERHLRKLAHQHLVDTAATDEAEDRLFGEEYSGDELPEKVRDRSGRGARITRALGEIEQRNAVQRERADAEQAAATTYVRKTGDPVEGAKGRPPKNADPVAVAKARYEREHARAAARYDAYQAKLAAAAARGHKLPGTAVVAPDEHPKVRRLRAAYNAALAAQGTDAAQTTDGGGDDAHRGAHAAAGEPSGTKAHTVNLTDPDSRLLKTRNGWIQGYNCQTAVSDDGFIVSARATQDSNDINQFEPTADDVTSTAEQLAEHVPDREDDLTVGTMVGDAGYDSDTNLDTNGPDRLIANAKRHDLTRRATSDPATGDTPEGAAAREQMDHRLRTPDGFTLYKRRAPLVEAPNAWLKDGRDLRDGFRRRGLRAAQSELCLASAATNLLRLFTNGITTARLAST